MHLCFACCVCLKFQPTTLISTISAFLLTFVMTIVQNTMLAIEHLVGRCKKPPSDSDAHDQKNKTASSIELPPTISSPTAPMAVRTRLALHPLASNQAGSPHFGVPLPAQLLRRYHSGRALTACPSKSGELSRSSSSPPFLPVSVTANDERREVSLPHAPTFRRTPTGFFSVTTKLHVEHSSSK